MTGDRHLGGEPGAGAARGLCLTAAFSAAQPPDPPGTFPPPDPVVLVPPHPSLRVWALSSFGCKCWDQTDLGGLIRETGWVLLVYWLCESLDSVLPARVAPGGPLTHTLCFW